MNFIDQFLSLVFRKFASFEFFYVISINKKHISINKKPKTIYMQKRILLLLPQYDSDSSDLAKLIMGPALIKTVVTEYVYSVDVLMRYELIGDSEVRWCKTMGGFLFSS